MPEITLDYTVPMSIRVDTDTGRVVYISFAGEEFQFGTEERPQPEQVFTCLSEWEGVELPEYVERDHPVAQQALAIVENIHLAAPEMLLPFHYIDAAGNDTTAATYGEVLGTDGTINPGATRFVREIGDTCDRYSSAAVEYDKRRAEERELERQANTKVTPGSLTRPSSLAGSAPASA